MNAIEREKEEERIRAFLDGPDCDLHAEYNEAKRVKLILDNTSAILDDLDEQFCRNIGLTKVDIGFLFTATCLQVARQYLITKFPVRLDDQSAAKKTFGHQEEHSDRHHRYYNPSLEEIITNPVPFDANIGANGALSGGGKMGHRVTAIGHDPILGLIIGTANIATSTLTTKNFSSFHISTDNNRDVFKCHARTELVFKYTFDKVFNQGAEGKTIVAASLIKEIIHLHSDLNTKNSLPLPFISAVDSQLASKLASYGLDMANVVTVGKQSSLAMLINFIIAMLHGIFYDGSINKQQYEVRTKKIIMYSSVISGCSNIGITAITKDVKNLDIGGLLVNFIRIIQDSKFIKQVKEDSIFGIYDSMIMGENLH